MKNLKLKNYSKRIWDIFEKTGCISAYLLYKEFNKNQELKKQRKKVIIKK